MKNGVWKTAVRGLVTSGTIVGLFLNGCAPATEPGLPMPTIQTVATAVPPTQPPAATTPSATAVPPTISPTITATPPPSPTPTAEPTITPTPAPPVVVDFNGVHFLLDGRIADQVYPAVETWGDTGMSYIVVKFAPDGFCRDVGCIEVYDVAAYEAARPDSPLPPLGAGTVLKTPPVNAAFQNGDGSRSLRMVGQMGYFANNEALLYEYKGFTADGRTYVLVTYPLDAAILFSTGDPAQNTNLDAIPLPAPLPDDFGERSQMMMAYNQEMAQRLALLPAAEFSPALNLLDALVASLLVEPSE